MKVIVAGGTGLIGTELIKELLIKGHKVRVLSRRPEQAHPIPGAIVVRWDGRTLEGWGNLVNETDAIINLAGASIGAGRWTITRKQEILNSRVLAGQTLVKAVEQAVRKPSILLQASAIGYYGVENGAERVESSPPGKDFLATVCVQWEDSTRPVERLGLRRVVFRTGLVLSREGGFMVQTVLPFRLFVGGPFGSGKQWWSWIHIRDEIDAILFLLENPDANGVYNLSAPNPVTMGAFGKELAEVIHRPYWLGAPAFGLRFLLGEMSDLVLGSQRVIPHRLKEVGFQFQYPELHPALADILL